MIANRSSPAIDDQNVTTQLSLADGATVLLGGFITEQKNDDDTGITYLKDVPGLGLLFRNSDAGVIRKETLIFITPYIINSGVDSQRITDSVKANMKAWPEVRTPSKITESGKAPEAAAGFGFGAKDGAVILAGALRQTTIY